MGRTRDTLLRRMPHVHAHLSGDDLRKQNDALRDHHAGMASWGIRERRFRLWFSGIENGASVLEIGCGSGVFATELLHLGYQRLTLADVDDYRTFSEAKALPFLRWDANREPLALPDASIDVIISLQVFEHLENVWHAMRECARVIRNGGRLIVSMPYGDSFLSRLRFVWTGDVIGYSGTNDHIAFLPKSVATKLWQSCGFMLMQTDWSEPFVKMGRWKWRWPRQTFLCRLASRKVCYVFQKQSRSDVSAPAWKTFSHTTPTV